MITYNMFMKLLLSLPIAVISIIGDKLVDLNTGIIKALIDNLTHSLVGGLSWSIIVLLLDESLVKNIFHIFLSMVISSFIDIDHFIEARDWRLNAATSLKKRPFLHCTTVPLLLWALSLIISKILNHPKWATFGWIILISFLSHHIRDGTRRGLWISPFGSTPKIPYYLYILIDMILPFVIYFSMIGTKTVPKNRATILMI